ncbi:MAG: hypothetical protein MJZ50_01775 [Treponema sp.]|nr:hypothetical protein [Treponema sp.]
MKTRTRLAFLFSILAAVTFMTACSFFSSSDDDDDIAVVPVTLGQAFTSTGTIGAAETAANGDIVRKATDTNGGTYEFRQSSSRAIYSGTWTYTESGKTAPTFFGYFSGDIGGSTLSLTLKISKVADSSGALLPVKEEKSFAFITAADGTFSVTIPAVEVTNVPRSLKIEQLPCDNGIALCVKNSNGTPLVIPQSERNSYGGNNQYQLVMTSEGKIIAHSINPTKWVFPYVNPNQAITLHLKLELELNDSNNLKKEVKVLAWDEITITPSTGLGKVSYSGTISLEYSKNGDLKVTATSSSLNNYRGDYWGVVTDFAIGKDWESMGAWVSNMYTRNDQFGQTLNFWKTNTYHHKIAEEGVSQGFLAPYVEYTYSVSDSERYTYRLENAGCLDVIKGISLDSLAAYKQSQGFPPVSLTKEFADKICADTVLKYVKNSSDFESTYCLIICDELSTAFKNKLTTPTRYQNELDCGSLDFSLPPTGSSSNRINLRIEYSSSSGKYNVYILKKNVVYKSSNCIDVYENVDFTDL